ncbi:MAG: P-loop NTPase fold protein [Rickettsiales bacterium]|nr:P-loop NTPase fold protein [Rickettsiales bacterium]
MIENPKPENLKNLNKVENLNKTNKTNEIEESRKRFAKYVADYIANESDSFFDDEENNSLVIGINGEWGEGKSKVKKEIEKQLDSINSLTDNLVNNSAINSLKDFSVKDLIGNSIKNQIQNRTKKPIKYFEFGDWDYSTKGNIYDDLFLKLNENYNLKEDFVEDYKLQKLQNILQNRLKSQNSNSNIQEVVQNLQHKIENQKAQNSEIQESKYKFLFVKFILYIEKIINKAIFSNFVFITSFTAGFISGVLYGLSKNFTTELITFFISIISIILSSIYKFKNELNKKSFLKPLIENSNKKFVIFIDDVDRLSKEEILNLIRIIRTNLNIKNIIYVLFYSKEIVAKAISEDYFDGYVYLEKIIDKDLTIPKLSLTTYSNKLFTLISNLAESNERFKDEFDELSKYNNKDNENNKNNESDKNNENNETNKLSNIIKTYFSNMRKVYRFIYNFEKRINYLFNFANNNCCYSICIFCLEVLKLNEEQIYKKIRENPATYIGNDFINELKSLEVFITFYNKYISIDNSFYNTKEAFSASNIIRYLKSKLSGFNETYDDNTDISNFLSKIRQCADEYDKKPESNNMVILSNIKEKLLAYVKKKYTESHKSIENGTRVDDYYDINNVLSLFEFKNFYNNLIQEKLDELLNKYFNNIKVDYTHRMAIFDLLNICFNTSKDLHKNNQGKAHITYREYYTEYFD